MKLVIDERIRKLEKEKIESFGYELFFLEKDKRVYEEISAHSDIFVCKFDNKLVVEKEKFEKIKPQISSNLRLICGGEIGKKYPEDIKYNVCIAGRNAIHNFNFTDGILKSELIKDGYNLINVNQGYSNCSIAVINENSLITCDKGIYDTLKKYDFDILFLEEKPDIKLLSRDKNNGKYNYKYSDKNGFIGGSICRIGNKIIVFGHLNKIDKNQKIRKFIEERKLEIVEFKGLDVIDYGGIVEI